MEPIAVIGLSCRFPGAESPAAFWELLREGRDAVGPGRGFGPGGYLDQVDGFDPAFFRISGREAASIDPQQRLLLELAVEALDEAGQDRAALAGTPVGVFVGLSTHDYHRLALADPGRIGIHSNTGSSGAIAANRISYALDLRGPSLTVDTACSSSLVAVHLACQSLREGESAIALAGGVNLILGPEIALGFAQMNAMAPDGRCKAFDARANGYVRSEGGGVLVLKPLSRALADGDPVHAVIRGSAVTQDGQTYGLTVPSRAAQEAMLRDAYARAGVDPAAVDYVEAHGTGTLLGDPIEAQALGAVLGEGREAPLRIGSVKTNLGHLEAAAGIAGAIKAVLALKHRALPASLHFETPNPHIDFEALGLRVATTLEPLPAVAVAGVSAFGFGGTNAHVVLEAAPLAEAAAAEVLPGPGVLPLSAHDPKALLAQARGVRALLPGARVEDLVFTASRRRTALPHRLALAFGSADDLAEQLDAYLADTPDERRVAKGQARARRPRVAFVFPGQGGQWPGMGRQLFEASPVFREAILACERAMAPWGSWSLSGELLAATRLDELAVVQPMLCAMQIGLCKLLADWGLRPDAVIGHSMGEVAAAHVAGSLSLEDAMRLVCGRSALMARVSGQGAMAMVELTLDDARAVLAGREDRLAIAVSNGPTSTVVAGDPAALDALLADLEAREVFCRRVQVDVASHSPQMDPLRDELLALGAALTPREGDVPFHSTVEAAIQPGEALDADYWWRNLRQPVLFGQTLAGFLGGEPAVLVEIGPHPVLLGAMKGGNAVALLRRDEDAWVTLGRALGGCWAAGVPLDWARVCPSGRQLDWPAYPWQRQRYWLEEAAPAALEPAGVHPFLARGMALATGGHVWEAAYSAARFGYLADHRIFGAIVSPGTGYLEMAIAAARAALGDGPVALDGVSFRQALALPDGAHRSLQVALSGSTLQVHSRPADDPAADWTLHAACGVALADAPADGEALAAVRTRLEGSPDDGFYERLTALGLELGPAFRGIRRLWRTGREALGEIQAPEGLQLDRYRFHPALLDACGQLVFAALAPATVHVPVRMARFALWGAPTPRLWAHCTLRDGAGADIRLFDGEGRAIGAIEGLVMQPLTEEAALPADYELVWRPWKPAMPSGDGGGSGQATSSAGDPPAPASGAWLIAGDRGGLGARLARRLEAAGGRCLLSDGSPEAALAEAGRALGEDFHVLDLRSLDAGSAREACDEAMGWVRAALERGFSTGPSWVTRGATTGAAPAQAAVWGLGRVFFQEHLDAAGRLIDLDPAAPVGECADALAALLLARPDEDQLAYRPGGWQVARLAPVVAAANAARPGIHPDAAYLITGGLGALGLELARWLAARGAGRIVLLGRSAVLPRDAWQAAPEGSREAALHAIERLGAAVTCGSVDVGDAAALRAFLDAYEADGGPAIRGVFHAAGVLRDGAIATLTPTDFGTVLHPKATGAWNLHEAFAGRPLDHFVLFSSAASVMGSHGQANYAAANAYLDALAHHRRALGLPALAINWGPWAGAGLAGSAVDRLAELGFGAIQPAEGLAALGRLMDETTTQAVYLPVDWARWSRTQRPFPLLRELVTPSRASALDDVPPRERQATFEAGLVTAVAKALHLPEEAIAPDVPLTSFGIDSLMALELRNAVEATWGVSIPMIKLLGGYSIEQMAADAQAPVVLEQRIPKAVPRAALTLYCFSHAGGDPAAYEAWAGPLAGVANVVPVPLPGRPDRFTPVSHADFAALVTATADALAGELKQPFAFYGHSMGSLLAYDVACELRRRGLPLPVHLLAGAHRAPSSPPSHRPVAGLDEGGFIEVLRRFEATPEAALRHPEFRALFLPAIRAEFELLDTYRSREEAPLPVPITAFAGLRDRAVSREEVEAWSRHTSAGFWCEAVEGNHLFLHDPACGLADRLKFVLSAQALPPDSLTRAAI